MDAHENAELCKKCGGFCCKKSGCDYSVNDFESKTYQYFVDKLLNENISIVSFQHFKETTTGRIYNTPFLYMRARNKDRGAIDLLSFKTTCSNLTSTGCSLTSEQRPTGGKNLIPGEPCQPEIDPMEIVKTWEPYQNVLRKIVKRMTGKSVEQQLEIDAYELFKRVLNRDFKGVSKMELEDVAGMLVTLQRCYPDSYSKARKEVNNVLLNTKRSNF